MPGATSMSRFLALAVSVFSILACSVAQADVVLDWNGTIRNVMQQDGTHAVNKADPGWSTRAIAMMNTAIYDVFQSFNRTHQPWLVNTHAGPNTSLEAAVHHAAYTILNECYAGESAMIQADYNTRMGLIPSGVEKTNGIALGTLIADACMIARDNDGSGSSVPYSPLAGPGKWRPDPWNPAQNVWGPEWGAVSTFGISDTASMIAAIPAPPGLNSQAYTDAFNQVKDLGALNSPSRTPEQTEIGLFWGYDRASMGPPPVMFVNHLADIAAQAGNTEAENARLFAMASVAQADAAIASWDAKFTNNFWRPVAGIQEAGVGGAGDADGNPDTIGDPDWRPLGAPGNDHDDMNDDFTPPFPSWTSGHATMGGAVFKSLELFYGTNSFDAIDGILGNDPDYVLTSEEEGGGGSRTFTSFTQVAPLAPGAEDSPEGENGMSRVYLGVHWIFDQTDGITLGRNIAEYVAANYFQAVPEPSAGALACLTILSGALLRRRIAG
ncbi:MAG TPA: vanadium-dependent haloperoxidase [Lacipirellula sp.]